MSVKVDVKYNNSVIDSLTSTGEITYATADKYLANDIKVDFTGTEDATATANDILASKTAYIADGSKATGTIPTKTASDMTVSGNTVTAPTGYYASDSSKEIPATVLDNTIISGQAFEEATGDYAWKSTVNLPAGYHNAQTIEKTFSDVFPAPATEGTSADLRLGKQLYNHEGKLLTGTIAEKSEAVYTASTSDQTISANQYLSGDQTIKAVSLNAVASNILSGTSVSVESNGSTITSMAGSIVTYDWTSVAGIINKPTNLNPVVSYTGSEITNGYICPQHVTMTGNDRGTNSGTYTAVYTPDAGYCWEDGSVSSITVVLTIALDYLCFTANAADSTVTCPQAFEYSTNTIDWNVASTGTPITLSQIGSKIYLRNGSVGTPTWGMGTFTMTGSISASGNIMSLVDNACSSLSIPIMYCFRYLFQNCTALTTPPTLPATTLMVGCYSNMFEGCTQLTTMPYLPAQTMLHRCYYFMFKGCSSLRNASTVAAITAGEECCYCMFMGCTSLAVAPVLSATTMANNCYNQMFSGCTSLVTPPTLPATTLAEKCYANMFESCGILKTMPKLPATSLAYGCYNGLFYGCYNLRTAASSSTTTPYTWSVPTSGVLTGRTYHQYDVFRNCASYVSADIDGVVGQSYTYYTQNEPV